SLAYREIMAEVRFRNGAFISRCGCVGRDNECILNRSRGHARSWRVGKAQWSFKRATMRPGAECQVTDHFIIVAQIACVAWIAHVAWIFPISRACLRFLSCLGFLGLLRRRAFQILAFGAT